MVQNWQGLEAWIPYAISGGRLQTSATLGTECDSCRSEPESRVCTASGSLSGVRIIGANTFERVGA